MVAECLFTDAQEIRPDAPLLDLGVDSVTALSLLQKIKAGFGVDLGVSELLAGGTIAGLAERLSAPRAQGGEAPLLVSLRRHPQSPIGLVLFPGAGGTALMLSPWAAPDLVEGVDVWAFHPPGHGGDTRPPIRRMDEMVRGYVAEIPRRGAGLVLLGHSLGAVVAFAVAHALQAQGVRPAALILSHGLPPHVWGAKRSSRSPDFEEIFGRLYERWSIDHQSRGGFIEVARADFEVAESYELSEGIQVECPTFIIRSEADEYAPARVLEEWRRYCRSATFYGAEGGHFDFLKYPSNRALLKRLYAEILGGGRA